MLLLKLSKDIEMYNEDTQKVFRESVPTGVEVRLEHSLISLSKWESKYKKPFLSSDDKTPEEVAYYVECMVVDEKYPEGFVSQLSPSNQEEIREYIGDTQTATTFRESGSGGRSRETTTSELIYYWLVAFNIPFEVESWNLNRLLTLIRICSVKNAKPEKQDPKAAAAERQRLNQLRREESGSPG